MTYESWRITYQSSEQAARAAYAALCDTKRELAAYKQAVGEATTYATSAKILIERRVAELLAANA